MSVNYPDPHGFIEGDDPEHYEQLLARVAEPLQVSGFSLADIAANAKGRRTESIDSQVERAMNLDAIRFNRTAKERQGRIP
jgi:hypothetical protein